MANNHGYGGVNAPIVIFFGQSAGGKTTALVRLIRYLQTQRYKFELSETFHNTYYGHLKEFSIKDIESEVTTQVNVASYDYIAGSKERALINICNCKNDCVCRFLEVPGEDFINLHEASKIGVGNQNTQYDYLKDVTDCEYKKIWVFFFDADFATNEELKKSMLGYIAAIQKIKIGPNDKIIVLLNKIDKITKGDSKNPIQESEYAEFINANFDSILLEEPFATKRWSCFGLMEPYKSHYELVGYSSFHMEQSNSFRTEVTWIPKESHEIYPQKLWKTIMRAIDNRYE
ncbi:MAG: hypothetical protein J1E57_05205 [Prevotella sp.]|nr:hypothetical protein [Prevotella sp.]